MFTVDVQIDGQWEILIGEFNYLDMAIALAEHETGFSGYPYRIVNEDTGKLVIEKGF